MGRKNVCQKKISWLILITQITLGNITWPYFLFSLLSLSFLATTNSLHFSATLCSGCCLIVLQHRFKEVIGCYLPRKWSWKRKAGTWHISFHPLHPWLIRSCFLDQKSRWLTYRVQISESFSQGTWLIQAFPVKGLGRRTGHLWQTTHFYLSLTIHTFDWI